MKRYKLKKDLPTFRAGDEFWLGKYDNLYSDQHDENGHYILAYRHETLKKFPNILTDWFEEIPERPKTMWDLKDGDKWWYIQPEFNESIIYSTHFLTGNDAYRNLGLAFLTKEEAEKELARRKARAILERDTKGFKPDWKECNFGYSVSYEVMNKNPHFEVLWAEWVDETIRFATEEDAQASIKAHEKEWKIYLGVEE